IAVSTSRFKQLTDTDGTSTTQSSGFEDIPGFSVTFELSEPCMVVMMMSIEAFVDTQLDQVDPPRMLDSLWRLVLNGTEVPGSRRSLGILNMERIAWTMWGKVSAISVTDLNPGAYELKGQFGWVEPGAEAIAFHRTLEVIIFRR